jgi:SAM-dependent methyltransferase
MGSMEGVVLAYSNRPDCKRFDLPAANWSPWNWASNWVLEAASPSAADRVLDLGCRDNPYVLAHARSVGSPTVLLDLAPPAAGVTLPPNVTFVRHDLTQRLPFPDASFDVVLSESSLEHLPQHARLACVAEAVRVLRPGGRFAVSIGVPLNMQDDHETIRAFASHPFFADRYCSVYCPVDIAAVLGALDAPPPYNAALFPGFHGFDETRLLGDPQLLFDRYGETVPDVGRLQLVSIVEVGVFAVRK